MDPQKTDFLRSNKSKFSPEVRKFALNLHFVSPRSYDFVRKSFNTCLPHARTLVRWCETVEGEPGFYAESLEALKLLVKMANQSENGYSACVSMKWRSENLSNGMEKIT